MRSRLAAVLSVSLSLTLLLGGPAAADHTDPKTRLSPTSGAPGGPMTTTGAGTWTFLRNFQANAGTDLEIFRKRRRWFASSGTLGQADEASVGQRIIHLRKGRRVRIRWMYDHGSANCPTANPAGTTGLQHDIQATPRRNTQILIDATDATGRCHDPAGGGLELIDATKLNRRQRFDPREIHLIRVPGTSHNNTVDATRPWIVYNSSSDFAGRPWIDVFDIRSCLDVGGGLRAKRQECRPKAYRIPFRPNWSRQKIDGELQPGSEAACHDITTSPGRLYCAALNATIVFDVTNLTRPNGRVRGSQLPCSVVPGTDTRAMVTDCTMDNDLEGPRARGWRFLGTFNHPGRDCAPTPGAQTNCNSNTEVESKDGVAVSHESDPTPDGRFLFVTDERGGGVVPGGASCTPGVDNPNGNGGLHVLNIRDPSNIRYARQPDGSKAVFIGEVVVPAATFCTMHVIEHVPREQRLIVGYYSQGVKIVDYWRDANGRWIFRETASLVLPGAATWAAEDFYIRRHRNGSATYFILISDIERGIDVVKWRGPMNPRGSPPPTGLAPAARTTERAAAEPVGVGFFGVAVLGALLIRRRRRRQAMS